jgi:hypothetical protein
MSITIQCEKDAPGAVRSSYSDHFKDMAAVYVRTFAVGMVVRTWERNGYDDSDFFATFWNPETMDFETIEYATTRGWTYANGAEIDASQALLDLFDEYRRGLALMGERDFRKDLGAKLAALGFDRPDHVEFFAGLDAERRTFLFKILRTDCRSEFRKSLQAQARAWLAAAPADRKYDFPFSPRQYSAIVPRGYWERKRPSSEVMRSSEIVARVL